MGWEDNIIERAIDRVGGCDSTSLDRFIAELLEELRNERDDLKTKLKAAEQVIEDIAGSSWGTVRDIPMAHRDLTIGKAEAYLASRAPVVGEDQP